MINRRPLREQYDCRYNPGFESNLFLDPNFWSRIEEENRFVRDEGQITSRTIPCKLGTQNTLYQQRVWSACQS